MTTLFAKTQYDKIRLTFRHSTSGAKMYIIKHRCLKILLQMFNKNCNANYTDQNVHRRNILSQPPISPSQPLNPAPLTIIKITILALTLDKDPPNPPSLHDSQTNMQPNYHPSARQFASINTVNQYNEYAIPNLIPRQVPLFTIFPKRNYVCEQETLDSALSHML